MAPALPDIYITHSDYERLSKLILHLKTSASEELEEELARAVVVPELELPFPMVTMNSTIRFIDLESNKESEFTLVFPENADVEHRKISILAPIGVALIGLKLNDIIDWPVPGGHSRRLQVVSISSGTADHR